jgi:hypothetical protein
MTQADLFTETPTPRQKKRGHVPRSSVAAYMERPRNKRVTDVLMALDETRVCSGFGDFRYPSTSAELLSMPPFLDALDDDGRNETDILLYVRRGLSDALALGLVSHAGERTCAVSGRKCITWAIKGR